MINFQNSSSIPKCHNVNKCVWKRVKRIFDEKVWCAFWVGVINVSRKQWMEVHLFWVAFFIVISYHSDFMSMIKHCTKTNLFFMCAAAPLEWGKSLKSMTISKVSLNWQISTMAEATAEKIVRYKVVKWKW